jgi:ABC-type transport system involved in cytochrome bd biosynthesis fused ATPase/permease subunit
MRFLFIKETNQKLKIAFLNSSANLFKISLIENILLGRKLSKKKLASIIDICRLQQFDLLGDGGSKNN